jgi:hypothetical protein
MVTTGVARQVLKSHVIDCSAQLCGSTLIYALIEVTLLGMSAKVSMQARLLTIALAFAGIGSVIARLRDLSLRLSGTAQASSESRRLTHDLIFSVVINMILAPIVYGIAGANANQIIIGTAVCIFVSMLVGPVNGYMIDRFRSWAGRDAGGRFAPSDPPASGRLLATVLATLVAITCVYMVVGMAR